MIPRIEIRLIMVEKSAWQFRLMINGGTVVVDGEDGPFPNDIGAMQAARLALRDEIKAARERRSHQTEGADHAAPPP